MSAERFPIPGLPGHFADADGGIWKTGSDGCLTRKSPAKNKSGYMVTSIRRPDGKWITCYVHRLVWLAFHQAIPDRFDVCHNNGDRSDNRLNNLRADTRKGNLADRLTHGTMNRGERCGSAKLNSHQVRGIRDLYATGGYSQSELGNRYGVCRTAIEHIVLRKNWRHV